MNSYYFFIYEFICFINSYMNSGVPRFQMFRCKAFPLLPRKRPQRSISRTLYANDRWILWPGPLPGAEAATATVNVTRNFFGDFRADETFTIRWSGGRIQDWVHFEPLLLAITPQGYARGQSKILTAKSMTQLLGQRWAKAGLTGEYKYRAFLTWLQLL